jgi:hypothetical protein
MSNCYCGDDSTDGVMHRKDGPCYHVEKVSTETKHTKDNRKAKRLVYEYAYVNRLIYRISSLEAQLEQQQTDSVTISREVYEDTKKLLQWIGMTGDGKKIYEQFLEAGK